MRATIISVLFFLLFATGLAACGNKGPLTLPEEDKKSQKSE
jgi:predicted small lipoprotein YifL